MDITIAILEFDGKHVAELRRARRAFAAADVPTLIDFCQNGTADQQAAATWIVKAVLESAHAVELPLKDIFACLGNSLDWPAALHLLQSVQYAPDAATASKVLPWLTHKKTLVRVWALDALWHLDPTLARPRVEAALDDPAASMRARARKLLQLS